MNAITPKHRRRHNRGPRMIALEPRFLFDGAAAATIVDATHQSVHPAPTPHGADPLAEALANHVLPADPTAAVGAPTQLRAADPSKDGGKKEAVFVDTSVSNWQALAKGVRAGVEVELIDGGQSGLAQMAKWAQNHTGYDAIHILSPGGEASLRIGSDTVTSADLSSTTAQVELAEIGHALNPGGEVLLYGSSIGAGGDGQTLLADLAACTGSVVAAADHAVGDTGHGGDWTLDLATGPGTVSPLAISGYRGTLDLGARVTADNALKPVLVQAADAGLDGGKLEVAFVDTSVAGWQGIVSGLRSSRPGLEIELIDGTRSGLAQMAAWADTHHGYDTIHVVSEGAEGALKLGADTLTDASLKNTVVAVDLRVIGGALKPGGEMLVYGSGIAAGADGQAFTTDLAVRAGVSVVAPGRAGPAEGAALTLAGAGALGGAIAAEAIQPVTAADNPHEVVVVDSTVVGWQTLVAGMAPSIPVIVLVPDAGGRGELAELAAALSRFHDLDAIHLVTEGRTGGIILGQEALWEGDLAAATPDIQAIRGALKSGGTLALYGCSVAGSDAGKHFIDDLATDIGNGVVVAASIDKTGPTRLGGDWELEYSTGVAATMLPFTLQGMQDISHCLGCVLTSDPFSYDGGGGNIYSGVTIYSNTSHSVVGANITSGFIQGYMTYISSRLDTTVADTTLSNFNLNHSALCGPDGPSITSETYDASTNTLTVTTSGLTTGDTIVVGKLSITGEGGNSYTLTSSNVTASSATAFSITLNAADQLYVEGLLDKNGTQAADGTTTFNLAAAVNWTGTAAADTTGNTITVSNVQKPTITSATYNSSTGVLVVTGTNMVHQPGAANDIDVTKLSLVGQGGSVTLTGDTSKVEITSATTFTVTLGSTDKTSVNAKLNANGTQSSGATPYNLSAADDWNGPITPAAGPDISDTSGNTITVSGYNAAPTVTAGGTTAYTEKTPAAVASGITINDPDGDADWNGGTLKVQITANNEATDTLYLLTGNPGGSAIWLDTSGNKLMAGSAQIGTADAASVTNGAAWTFTFNASATNALVQAVSRAILFDDNTTTPSSSSRTVTFTATDKNSNANAGTQTVTVDPIANLTSVSIANGTRIGNTTYRIGDTVNVTVNFDQAVNVTGAPTLALKIGSDTSRVATYASGTGTSALIFSYVIQAGDTDSDGIDATANGIALPGGATIKDKTGGGDSVADTATLTYSLVNNTNALVDGTAPGTPSVTIDLADASDSGVSNTDNITNVTNPTLRVSLTGTSAAAGDTLELLLGGSSLSHAVTKVLNGTDISNGYVDMTVTAGDLGGDGIKVFTAQVTDPAGNAGTAGGTLSVTLDTTAPTVGSITAADITASAASSTFTITYTDGGGSGIDSSSIATGNVTLNNSATIGNAAWNAGTATYTITPPGGAWDMNDSNSYTIAIVGSQIKDLAGNSVVANASAKTFTVNIPNTPPTSSNDTVTLSGNATKVLAATDFGTYSDAEGSPLAKVKIVALGQPVLAGKLEYDTTGAGAWTAVTLNQEITKADIDGGRLRFTPSNSGGRSVVEFKVSDGTDYSTGIYTMTLGPGNTGSVDSVVKTGTTIYVATDSSYSLSGLTSGAAPSGLPRTVKMPLGQIGFTISGVAAGGTATVTLTVDASAGVKYYYKKNLVTNVWDSVGTVNTVGSVTTITLSLTDGGVYDSDRTANGVIVDPGVLLGDDANPQVMENTTYVADLSNAMDLSALHGAVTYTLSGGADQGKFSVDAATGVMRFVTPPNYEAPTDTGGTAGDNIYVVQATASDTFGNSVVKNLNVTVVNDTGVDGMVKNLEGDTASIAPGASDYIDQGTAVDFGNGQTGPGGDLSTSCADGYIVISQIEGTRDGSFTVNESDFFSGSGPGFNNTLGNIAAGSTVFGYDQAEIGTVDAIYDGQNGHDLRINLFHQFIHLDASNADTEIGTVLGFVYALQYQMPATIDGPRAFLVTLNDGTGSYESVMVDVKSSATVTAPAITGVTTDTGTSSSDAITNDTTLIVRGTADASKTITVYKDGTQIGTTTSNGSGAWSYDYTGTTLAEGAYSFTAKETVSGTMSGASNAYRVILDTTPPTLTSITADQSYINIADKTAASATLAGAEVGSTYALTISSSGGGTNVTRNGTIATAADAFSSLDLSGLNDGTLTYSITLTDTAGNTTTRTTTIIKDTVAPTLTSITAGQSYINAANKTAASATLAGAEVGSTYALTISSSGGGTNVTRSGTVASATDAFSSLDLSGLGDGTLTYSVVLTDAAGNTTTRTTTETKDIVAPALTGAVHIASNNATTTLAKTGNTVTLTFTTDGTETGTPTVTIDGHAATVTNPSGHNFSATYTMAGTEAEAAVTFSISASDLAGNAMTAVTAVTDASSVTFDKTPPHVATATMSSNNATNTLAKVGDVITVAFATDGTQNGTPTATIAGHAVTVTHVSGNNYTATYTMASGDSQGAVAFTIDASDLAGNAMTEITAVTSGSAVTFDKTAPDAPTAVTLTPVGGTVVSNTLNTTNTNMTAQATITAGQATGGKAELYIGATLIATDSTILVGDSAVTFDLGKASAAALEAAVTVGGTATVKLYDAAGNSTTSSVANPTLVVDYAAPTYTTITRSDLLLPSGTSSTFTVTYADTGAGIDAASIAAGNVTVKDPGNNSLAVTNASWNAGTNTATYTFAAPGGSWDSSDMGVYRIALTGNSVKDLAGNTVAAAASAKSFNVIFGPTVTASNITLSGHTGLANTYKIGDIVTATWNNSGSGDNNAGVTGVTFDFTGFGGGAAVTATNTGNLWSASYTITAGAIDATNVNVSIAATDTNGTTPLTGTNNATVDDVAPTVTTAKISFSGASGTGGAFKIGDTVIATWDNSFWGDNNSDTMSSVTFDLSRFGGGTAVAATRSGSYWNATYTVTAGSLDASGLTAVVTVIDNAGNSTVRTSSATATVDSIAPTVSASRITLSGATGLSGAYKIGDTVTATWNNSFRGDNNSHTIGTVTFDLSQFGGGSAVVGQEDGGVWRASYTITGGDIDAVNRNVLVTATDTTGNSTVTTGTNNATVDSIAPKLTTGGITLSGATGADGSIFKIGDVVTATWNASSSGDNEADTMASVKVDFSSFGGGNAVSASNSNGIWTAKYTLTAGSLDSSSKYNVTVTATDNAGNVKSVTGTNNARLDNQSPETPDNPSLSSDSDTGVSNSDGITKTTTPTFTGSAEPRSTITLYDSDGRTVLGTTTANSSGNWKFTLPNDLSNGSHTIRVTATDQAGNVSKMSSGTTVIIETRAPTVSDPGLKASPGADTGTTVGVVSGTDPGGQSLQYQLVDDYGGHFAIDPASGKVTIANAIDTDTTAKSFQITVRVTNAAGLGTDKVLTIEKGTYVAPVKKVDQPVVTVIPTTITQTAVAPIVSSVVPSSSVNSGGANGSGSSTNTPAAGR